MFTETLTSVDEKRIVQKPLSHVATSTRNSTKCHEPIQPAITKRLTYLKSPPLHVQPYSLIGMESSLPTPCHHHPSHLDSTTTQRFGTSKERPAGPLLNVSPQRMCFPNDFPVRSQPSMTTSTRITNRTSKQLAPPDILLPPPSPHLSTLLLMNSMCSTDSTDGPEDGWQVSHADQNCSKTVRAEIVSNTPTSRLQIEKSGSDREVSPVLDVPNVILLRESCSRYSESSTSGGGGISKRSHKMKQFTPNNNCKHNKTATAPSLSHQPTSITFHNPRKTHYAKRKRTCNSITKEELLSVLHLSQTQACQVLGCSVSTVKRRFYDLKDEIGISHWPKDYFELAIHNKKVFQKIYPMSLSFILNPEQEQQSME